MGEISDMLIDGTLDMYTGEYIGDSVGYPRTKETVSEKNIRKVRKELAILIQQKKEEGDPQAVNNARKEINLKYGKGWRERRLCVNDSNQWKPLSKYK